MTIINVETSPAYEVEIGAGALQRVRDFVSNEQRVALIADESIDINSVLAFVQPELTIRTPAGEAAKHISVVASAWESLGEHGFTRSDLIISVGGGATTDVAGFIAATWLRGIDVIHVPTTILGMVDAAVGGKTGIDTAEGKNLVGAFHQPKAVIADTNWLKTLPAEQVAGGLAEIIKCGFIADPSIIEDIEKNESINDELMQSLIERGVRVKAEVVARDTTERTTAVGQKPGRESLNYGHTLGHAIERFHKYEFGHGQAIAIGMVFAAELARLNGLIDEDLVTRHREVLTKVGLPVTHAGSAWPQLQEAMKLDKKNRGNKMRFLVLNALGATTILADPDHLDSAYRLISS